MDTQQSHLLLIEDNPGDARLVIEMLKDAKNYNFVVDTADSMLVAKKLLVSKSYQLILVDLTLPDSSGLNTVTTLLELEPEMPIVVMTGMEDEKLSLQTVQAGAQDYLVKNQISSVLLIRTILHAIERNRLRIELDHAKHKQEELATHDALTSLPNRVLFHDRLEQCILKAKRKHSSFAVLFIDLVRFKQINDSLGHEMGDRMLKEFSLKMTNSLRDCDTAARYGGDEFVCILEGISDKNVADTVAKKILHACEEPIELDGKHRKIVPSIGVTLFPKDGENAKEILAHADSAMYIAKKSGQSNVAFFNAALHEQHRLQLSLAEDLQQAARKNQLAAVYQPVLDANANLVAVEALVRWQHPRLGLLTPNHFIKLAEDNNIIGDIDLWMLKESCKQNKAWQDAGHNPTRMAVNVAAQQFCSDSSLVQNVKDVLAKTQLDPQWLELEINESASMNDPDATVKIVNDLRDLGVCIAIDDFGTGYSSLSYLQRFKIDTLKIDRAFVKDVMSNPESAAITRTIIALAKSLSLKTVAEGVENNEQEDFLKVLGCDFIQGFLYSRPVSRQRMLSLFKEGFASLEIKNASLKTSKLVIDKNFKLTPQQISH